MLQQKVMEKELKKAEEWVDRLEDQLLILGEKVEYSLGPSALAELTEHIGVYFKAICSEIVNCGIIAKRGIALNDSSRHYVELMIAHAEMAGRFSNRLLTFSRKRTVDLRSVDPDKVINNLTRFLLALSNKRIKLQIRLSSQNVRVMADPVQMGQALCSLVSYGGQLMSDEGVITIGTKLILTKYIQGTGSNAESCNGRCLLLYVNFSNLNNDKRFASSMVIQPNRKRKKEGSSLALSVIHGIIKAHNGSIASFKETGQGTQFNIYLPVLQETRDPDGVLLSFPGDSLAGRKRKKIAGENRHISEIGQN
jgi:signal transduction histidine kinase